MLIVVVQFKHLLGKVAMHVYALVDKLIVVKVYRCEYKTLTRRLIRSQGDSPGLSCLMVFKQHLK